MKKWVWVFSLILMVAWITMSCSSQSSVEKGSPYSNAATTTMASKQYDSGINRPAAAPAPIAAGSPADSYEFSAVTPSSGIANGVDRKVIRTGAVQLVVKDITTALDNIKKLASDNGGYVVSSQKWKENERNFGSISIRILAENYDKSLAELRSLAISVTSETSSSQDVTEEYTDLSSRLKNLEAAEAQLLKIMQDAIKTEDVLAVQRELTTVRGNIEQTKGRMLYIERTTSTSLININLNEAVFALKFSADKVRVNTNEFVTFIPQVTGGFEPFSYQWDFGDGERSTEVSPRHAFKRGGTYSIGLIVTDDKGYSNQSVRPEYINVQSNWNAGSVASSAWNALKVVAKVAVNLLIWIVTFIPVWIVIGAIVWLSLYLKKRKNRKLP